MGRSTQYIITSCSTSTGQLEKTLANLYFSINLLNTTVDAMELILNNSVGNQSKTLRQLEPRSPDAFNKMNAMSARCKSKGI